MSRGRWSARSSPAALIDFNSSSPADRQGTRASRLSGSDRHCKWGVRYLIACRKMPLWYFSSVARRGARLAKPATSFAGLDVTSMRRRSQLNSSKGCLIAGRTTYYANECNQLVSCDGRYETAGRNDFRCLATNLAWCSRPDACGAVGATANHGDAVDHSLAVHLAGSLRDRSVCDGRPVESAARARRARFAGLV